MSLNNMIREARVVYVGPARRAPEQVRGPEDSVRFLRPLIGDATVEFFAVVALDGRHRPIAHYIASQGTLNATLVHPREVFRPALMLGAAAIIVAHNHPSGDPVPSPEDRAVTKRLRDAGDLLGVAVLDSIVIGANGFHSLRNEGGWQ